MADDEPRHQDDEPSGSDESRRDTPGPITIATTDPVIESAVEHQSDWKGHPDTTVRVETTQVSEPSPLSVSGVRTVAAEPQRQGRRRPDERRRPADSGRNQDRGQRNRGQDQDDRQDRSDRQDRPQQQQQPSMTKNLLITAGVALLCGVIGAMGYSYFSGSKSGESEQSEGKNEQAKSQQSGSAKKSIPGFSSAEDADTLKKQIMDLMQRVDRLNERVDRMTRPRDDTPPVLRTMQIKMGELVREMDGVASLPAQVRHFENRLETLQEDLKALRARIKAMQDGSVGGRKTPGVTLPPVSATSGRMEGTGPPDDPTLDLGIGLLERGQYASAREVFLRLQVAQPEDARVWYFSALAEGLTSGDWNGEAKRLADKGLECERAGRPSTARIDAALATRTPIKGEDWIASLRRRVLSASSNDAK
jgi:hypothetical protein